jgi:hypothetical protein
MGADFARRRFSFKPSAVRGEFPLAACLPKRVRVNTAAVNTTKPRHLLVDLARALTKTQALIEEARALLLEARKHHDPLAVHIFNARRKWQWAVANDGKSGRKCQMTLRLSYPTACDLGYTAAQVTGVRCCAPAARKNCQ